MYNWLRYTTTGILLCCFMLGQTAIISTFDSIDEYTASNPTSPNDLNYTYKSDNPELWLEALPESCSGSNEGHIIAHATSGCPPYSYTISRLPDLTPLFPANPDSVWTNLSPADYRIVLTDACHNIQTREITLEESIHPGLHTVGPRRISKVGCDTLEFFWAVKHYVSPIVVKVLVGGDTLTVVDSVTVGHNQPFRGTNYIGPFHVPYGSGEVITTDNCGDLDVSEWELRPHVRGNQISISDCASEPSLQINIGEGIQQTICTPARYSIVSHATGDTILQRTFDAAADTIDFIAQGRYKLLLRDCCDMLVEVDPIIIKKPQFDLSVEQVKLGACDSTGQLRFFAPDMFRPITLNFLSGPEQYKNERNSLATEYLDYPIKFEGINKAVHAPMIIANVPFGSYLVEAVDNCNNRDTVEVSLTEINTYNPKIKTIQRCKDDHAIVIDLGMDEVSNTQFSNFKLWDMDAKLLEKKMNVGDELELGVDTIAFENLSAGTYAVSYDIPSRGEELSLLSTCPLCREIRDTIEVLPYMQPEISSINGQICFDLGSFEVTVSKGAEPYIYQIIDGPVDSLSQSNNIFNSIPSGTYTIRVIDACGNSDIETFHTAHLKYPEVHLEMDSCLQNPIRIYADETSNATFEWYDPSGNLIGSNQEVLLMDFNCLEDAGLYTLKTIIEGCGDTSIQVMIEDPTIPEIVKSAEDFEVECDGFGNITELNQWLNNHGGALLASDICGDITWTHEAISTEIVCSGQVSATYLFIASDQCLKADSTIAKFHIIDSKGPVPLQSVDNITVNCANDVPIPEILRAEDICGGEFEVLSVDSMATNQQGQLYIIRRWTYSDACGNSSNQFQKITIEDRIAPEIICPAPVTLNCSESMEPEYCGYPVTSDNCEGEILLTYLDSLVPGSCCNEKVIHREWRATDLSNNTSRCFQIISVEDNDPPEFLDDIPADIQVACIGEIPPRTILRAKDQCFDIFEVTPVDDTTSYTCINSLIIQRIWIATDSCGNSLKKSQKIVVQDDMAPSKPVNFPEDISIHCMESLPQVETLIAIDGCDDSVPSIFSEEWVIPDSNSMNRRVLVRSWTFVDKCGNQATYSQRINLNRDIAPMPLEGISPEIVVDCPSDVVPAKLEAMAICGGILEANSSDKIISGEFECEHEMMVERSWTFTDEFNNDTTILQTIRILNVVRDADVLPDELSVQLGSTIEIIPDIEYPEDYTFDWSPDEWLDCGDCEVVIAKPEKDISYEVTISDMSGCCMKDEVFINVDIEPHIYIPSAFSPNNDNVNDYFKPGLGIAIEAVEYLAVYNKWGGMVYEERNDTGNIRGWDGMISNQQAGTGTYAYLIKYRRTDGYEGMEHGSLNLIR